MRNINRIIISVTSTILIICVAIYINIKDKDYLYIPKNLVEITDSTFIEKIENKEDFILYLYGDTCKYCEKFSPIFDITLKNNNLTAYKICSDRNDDYFNTLSEKLAEKFQATPAVYFYKDGEIVDYFIGLQNEDIIQKYISKNINN